MKRIDKVVNNNLLVSLHLKADGIKELVSSSEDSKILLRSPFVHILNPKVRAVFSNKCMKMTEQKRVLHSKS